MMRILTALVFAAAALAQTQPPNIVLILTDDHAYQALSAYGYGLNQTPELDRLARGGMLFREAMVTNSLCAPSRAVILTGKYSHLNGVHDNRESFNGGQVTFPKLLRQAGYQTAWFGKWHLKSSPTGFDAWEVLPGQGDYYNPAFQAPSGATTRSGYVTDLITDISLGWLRNRRDRTRPFLMVTSHKAPHRNWMPAPRHMSLYEDVRFPEPPTLFDDYANRASPARRQRMEIGRDMQAGPDLKLLPLAGIQARGGDLPGPFARFTPAQKRVWDAVYTPRSDRFRQANLTGQDLVRAKYQIYMREYLSTVAAVDESIGRLLRYLDEEGIANNTVVIYTSDQGFYLGEHGWFDKRWMYQESLKTPLLVRWPGVVKPGTENRDLVSNVDLAETILQIAGVPVPAGMQGRSLVPVLKSQTPPDWRKSFYYHYYENGAIGPHNVSRHDGVTTGRHKLIHYYDDSEWELFDLRTDPNELRSVYSDPAYAKVVTELKQELARLRQELKVPAN